MIDPDLQRLFAIQESGDSRGFSLLFKDCPLERFPIAGVEPGAMRGNHVHDNDEVLGIIGGAGTAEILLEGDGRSGFRYF